MVECIIYNACFVVSRNEQNFPISSHSLATFRELGKFACAVSSIYLFMLWSWVFPTVEWEIFQWNVENQHNAHTSVLCLLKRTRPCWFCWIGSFASVYLMLNPVNALKFPLHSSIIIRSDPWIDVWNQLWRAFQSCMAAIINFVSLDLFILLLLEEKH